MRGKEGSTIVTIAIAVFMWLALLSPICHSTSDVEEEITGFPAGWSDYVNISSSSSHDKELELRVWGDSLHAVWVNDFADIVHSKSNNSGQTWSEFFTLFQSSVLVFYPDLAVSGENVHVVWGDIPNNGISRVYYRDSSNDGETWNTEKIISSDTGFDAANPSITVNNSNVHILWHDFRVGINGQVFYRRSLDGGITFDNGQGVDEDRQITFSPSTIGSVMMAGDGSNISVIWYDERNGFFDLYWMISKDNGYTWEDGLGNVGQDRRLTTSGDSQHAIAVEGTNIHIAYIDENWPGPTSTVYYFNSTDNGATWNSPVLLSGPNSASFAPEIAVSGDSISVMWNDNRDGAHELFYKNSTDGGITWSPDMRITEDDGKNSYEPTIALNESIIHLIWLDNEVGNQEVYYKRYPDFPPDPPYNISLGLGWNLISFPLEQRDESISEVLSSIGGKWDYIQAYDSLDLDHWKTNATFKPAQLNDLHSLNHRMGFWINITEPNVTLTVQGPIASSTSIPLYAGWNLVGYPSLVNETVANALWGTGADKVEVFDPGEPYRIREVGPSYVMKPGEGYWVHVPADAIWTIDW